MCTSSKARGDCTKRRGYECRGTRCVRRRTNQRTGNRSRTTSK